jgi:Mn-dependent DtxR family transcriptional regulator
MVDELQIDEVLETIWVLEEHGESAEVDRMQVHGAVPVGLLVERMVHAGLVTSTPHPPEIHEHRTIHNPCHEELTSVGYSTAEGSYVVEMTARGRQRAGDIIRRHRLTERLFTDSLHMENESEIAEQACKFEHILSQEATDKICAFLGHPTTCPHGAPIPPGPCCGARFVQQKQELLAPVSKGQATPRG